MPALKGAPVWDDHGILDKSLIGGGTWAGAMHLPFNGNYYRPFTSASYLLDHQLFGPIPFLFHQTNLLLHAFGAVAVCWMALVVLGRRDVALLAGVLFAVQPTQVGAVAWIGGRCDAWSALLGALFLGALARYVPTRDWRWLALAASTFFAAIMVKEQNIVIGIAAPLAEYCFAPKGGRRTRTSTLTLALFGAIFVSLWFVNFPDPLRPASISASILGDRALIAYQHYVGLFLIPSPAGMSALSPALYQSVGWRVLGGALILLTVYGLVRTARTNRPVFFLAMTALAVYLPVSGVVPMPSLLLAPYRVAAAGGQIAAITAFAIFSLVSIPRAGRYAIAAAYTVFCAYMTSVGIRYWDGDLKWFTAVAQNDPNGWLGVLKIAYYKQEDGDFDGAQRDLDGYMDWLLNGPQWRQSVDQGRPPEFDANTEYRVLTMVGRQLHTREVVTPALNLRARSLMHRGQRDLAIANLRAAVASDPHDQDSLVSLGDALSERDLHLASLYYTQALAAGPRSDIYSRLANVNLKEGKFQDAAGFFQQAIDKRPWLSQLWAGLAEARLGMHDREGAKAALDRAQSTALGNGEELKALAARIEAK